MPSDDDLNERLRRLGFRLPRDAFAAFLTHLHKSRVSPTETLEQLADLEERARDTVNLARRTRTACLGTYKPLDRFDWAHPRLIDRPLIDRLMTLEFVERGANVLIKGGSGVGKTMIAQNVGLAGLAAGYTVRFASLAAALADLLNQESLPAFERRLRSYTKPALLLIDELGYLPADARGGDILYNIISRRHQLRPTVITTNLAFKQWGTIFPGAACVAALVDRFTESCHAIEIDADSWRQRNK